jgi:hypothetical protein
MELANMRIFISLLLRIAVGLAVVAITAYGSWWYLVYQHGLPLFYVLAPVFFSLAVAFRLFWNTSKIKLAAKGDRENIVQKIRSALGKQGFISTSPKADEPLEMQRYWWLFKENVIGQIKTQGEDVSVIVTVGFQGDRLTDTPAFTPLLLLTPLIPFLRAIRSGVLFSRLQKALKEG